MYGYPHVDLFANKVNTKLPLYMSPVFYHMAWKQDAFQLQWDGLSIYIFSPFSLLRQVLLRVMLLTNLYDPGSNALASEGVVHRSSGSSGGGISQTPHVVEHSGSTSYHKDLPGLGVFFIITSETTKQLVYMARIFEGGCRVCHN